MPDMVCVLCEKPLPERINGQYVHAHCQLVPGWKPCTTAEDFAIDEALATGGVYETKAALRDEVSTAFDKAVAERGRNA